MKRTILSSGAGLCLGLGACSGEPSEATMRQAASDFLARSVQARLSAVNLMMGGPRGGAVPPIPVVSSFQKLGCVPAAPAATGHVCEFEVGIDGVARGRDKGRFYTDAAGVVVMAQ